MRKLTLAISLTSAITLTNQGFASEDSTAKITEALKTSPCTEYSSQFSECKRLTSLDLLNSLHTMSQAKIHEMFGDYQPSNCKTNNCKTNIDVEPAIIAEFTYSSSNMQSNPRTIQLKAYKPLLDMSRMFKETDMMFAMFANFSYKDTAKLTKNVTDMHDMFSGAAKLVYVNLGNIDTSNITNMQNMFKSCVSLRNIDLSMFNTSKVTNMSGMFSYCSSLEQLDISKFDMSNVKSVDNMFSNCISLKVLVLPKSEIQVSHLTVKNFFGCENLNLNRIVYK